jgi:hypothetical protein
MTSTTGQTAISTLKSKLKPAHGASRKATTFGSRDCGEKRSEQGREAHSKERSTPCSE